jgi:Animal haem peroxidase
MADMSRRALLRLGLGAGGAVVLLANGGRALAGTTAPVVKTPLPPTTSNAQLGHFGFMFPNLPPFLTDTPDPAAAVPALQALAASMLDPNITTANNPTGATFSLPAPGGTPGHRDNLGMGSAFTYLGGQFTDHDMILDLQPQPTDFFGRDSSGFLLTPGPQPQRVDNFETFDFDLSSVYGGGPGVSPQLYDADGVHFLVQEDNGNGVRDLPRNPDGTAILVEHRNDENEIIAQAHVALISFHNAIADQFGTNFKKTRKMVLDYYQWAFLHEVLPHFCGQDVIDGLTSGSIPSLYDPGKLNKPLVPFELTGAAYRFGHSMVRKAYIVNDLLANGQPAPPGAPLKLQVFNGTDADLHGGRPIPAFRQIEWGNFLPELNEVPPEQPGGADVNFSRIIDTLISSGLFTLPIGGQTGAEASGSNVLGFRNMLRGYFYGLASGQDIAAAMGETVWAPTDVIDPGIVPGFSTGTPLWYYILYDSFRQHDGTRLGPVGARLVADVFLAMYNAKGGLFRGHDKKFIPEPPIAPSPGQFGLADLVVFAGVATRP